jgi:hypothetical protein
MKRKEKASERKRERERERERERGSINRDFWCLGTHNLNRKPSS